MDNLNKMMTSKTLDYENSPNSTLLIPKSKSDDFKSKNLKRILVALAIFIIFITFILSIIALVKSNGNISNEIDNNSSIEYIDIKFKEMENKIDNESTALNSQIDEIKIENKKSREIENKLFYENS